jgi:hypothetical protein
MKVVSMLVLCHGSRETDDDEVVLKDADLLNHVKTRAQLKR